MLQLATPVVHALADQEIVVGTPVSEAVADASTLAEGATTLAEVSVCTLNV